jgi:CBS domain-containing protein
METIGSAHHILQAKGGPTWTTTPGALVLDALRLMGEKNIGALVVMDHGKVVGMVSERDYSRKIVLLGRTSRDTYVSEILSQPVITVGPDTPISECMRLMTEHRVRHLPVVDDDRLVGIISVGDVVNWVIHSQRETINHLEGYITGQYPG